MKRALAVSALAASLGGCGALADRMTPVDVPIWRPGVTTEAEVVAALGPPADRSYLPEGRILERWRGYVGVRTHQRLAYGFVFDPAGRLVRNANAGEMHAPGL
ncbi:MAG: hypothetical protein INR64_07925 [Caulobacteraceae bacterium]|nr:hypothetical protein [Caulobacter sp.]